MENMSSNEGKQTKMPKVECLLPRKEFPHQVLWSNSPGCRGSSQSGLSFPTYKRKSRTDNLQFELGLEQPESHMGKHLLCGPPEDSC